MEHSCEGCEATTDPDSYDLFDYCFICSRNLCDECMKKGCCGHQPALSGFDEDGTHGPDGE